MTVIFRTLFGSHLYGTATEQSDVDYKQVFIPSARDILLGTGKETTKQSPKADDRSGFQEKNNPGDVETEGFSLRKYLHLASQGQTVALDMLFATPAVLRGDVEGEAYDVWIEVWKNRHRLASRQCASFLGYCRQQANKYGIKGSRVAAVEHAVKVLGALADEHGHLTKLGEVQDALEEALLQNAEHVELLDLDTPSGGKLRHMSVCNRKAPYTFTLKNALEIYRKLDEQYGHRAKQARSN